MDEQQIKALARERCFTAAFLDPREVPFKPEFRKYCQENLCGNYNANYSCPPYCGQPEQMQEKILAAKRVLVISSHLVLNGDASWENAADRNAPIYCFLKQLREMGFSAFAVGFTGCSVCKPCKCVLKEPCAFPEKRMSCMSAYCVDVAQLARKCGMDFAWKQGELYLFGMIVFHKTEDGE